MGCCCLPPDRVKLEVNSKKETNSRVKMGKGSRWVSVIYPLKELKWGSCCLPPDRVKPIVNSKKETNSRVKMGKGSRWASVIYLLKESKCAAAGYPLRESNWLNSKKETKGGVKLGQKESSWAWVKLAQAHFDSESSRAKESRWVGTHIFT